MKWLTRHMVDSFHRESLARFGGADGTRDEGLLVSALARAENTHAYDATADIFRLAATYCFGVVKNHPFLDGNKRTGVLSAVAFLGLNDVRVEFDEPYIVSMVIGVAAGDVSEEEFADWLRKCKC
ncbi:MAG: type II toxin-antitoxin system death-on-curing family toxin [Rhizobiales bacterium]|nr:type II toxin-antitoxin system death-on-curing family toxin [Hyphomicrobiales bacterium]